MWPPTPVTLGLTLLEVTQPPVYSWMQIMPYSHQLHQLVLVSTKPDLRRVSLLKFIQQYTTSLAQCATPTAPAFGNVVSTGVSVGSGAAYSCDDGFELVGAFGATCTSVDPDTSEFSPAPPTCERK